MRVNGNKGNRGQIDREKIERVELNIKIKREGNEGKIKIEAKKKVNDWEGGFETEEERKMEELGKIVEGIEIRETERGKKEIQRE